MPLIFEIRCFRTIVRMALSAIIILLAFTMAVGQNPVADQAFTPGEQLFYELTYKTMFGDITAGTAKVSIDKFNGEKNNGHPEKAGMYKIDAAGKTNSFFDFFFKVRDHFQSFVDTSTLLPQQFVSHTREGKYVFSDHVVFDRKNKKAISTRNEVPVPDDVHDILSSVYFLRTLTLEDFGPDSTIYFDFFLDDSVYHSRVIFLGKETLDTDWGKIPCLKVKPMMATGDVFIRNYPVTMWVTDDRNHIPVRAESEIIVGAVVMKLVGFRNLKNPFILTVADDGSTRLVDQAYSGE